MRASLVFPLGLAILGLALAGCASDLHEPTRFTDGGVCDLDIQHDLLIPRCSRSGCHVPYQPASGVEFVSGDLGARLRGMPSATCDGRRLIDPDAPEDSYLLNLVSEAPTCGEEMVERMPVIGAPLSEAELGCLREWVAEVAAEEDP